jgi:hypothetical protein
MPVDERITYKFINGKYKEINHAGLAPVTA